MPPPLVRSTARRPLVLGLGAIAAAAALAVPVLAGTQAGPLLVTVTTSPNPYALEGNTSVTKSVGVLGYGTGTTDVALEGYATQAGSTGLEGFSDATSGAVGNGVFGYANNGAGIYGVSEGTGTEGVVGVTKTSDTTGATEAGVAGIDQSVDANNFGVYGKSRSGYGIYGTSTTSIGVAGTSPYVGVYGVSDAGTGVYASSTSGTAVAGESNTGQGLYGFSASNDGVYGSSNTSNGVLGLSGSGTGLNGASTSGNGIYGQTADTTSDSGAGSHAGVAGEDYTNKSGVTGNAGVEGISINGTGVLAMSTAGPGVKGISTTDTGVDGYSTSKSGVYGQTDDTTSANGAGSHAGVHGDDASDSSTVLGNFGVLGSSTHGTGVAATSVYGSALTASVSANSAGGAPAVDIELATPYGNALIVNEDATNIMTLTGTGNVYFQGSVTSDNAPEVASRDATGARRVTYAQRSTESTMEDFGQGQLIAGRAYVALDPTYASMLGSSDYLVFVTPKGQTTGVYVTDESTHGFEVVENQGRSSVAFDYRIVGRPRTDQPETRLALYTQPVPSHRSSPNLLAHAASADRKERFERMSRVDRPLVPHVIALKRPSVPKGLTVPPMPFVFRPNGSH